MSHAPAVDDPDNDDGHIMRRNFFKELCKKDREVNEDGRPNVFTIEQIWRKSTNNFTLDDVISHVRGYSMEEEPQLEFVGRIDENRIRLTDSGRNINCED
jgi:hypothetical protein